MTIANTDGIYVDGPGEVDYLQVIYKFKARQLQKLGLTNKEWAIAELMLKGLSDAEIGIALANTTSTIKHHALMIRRKAKVTTRTEFSALIFGMLG